MGKTTHLRKNFRHLGYRTPSRFIFNLFSKTKLKYGKIPKAKGQRRKAKG